MRKNPIFWVVAILSLVIDHLTKFWVVDTFELTVPPETIPIWPGVFHFTYVVNTGAAFSLFNNGVFWLRWLSLLVSLILIGIAVFGPRFSPLEQASYGFILGGALGNGIDRFVSGHVVDFLDFRLIQFPIFNLADVSINIGMFLFLIVTFRQDFQSPKSQRGDRSKGQKK